MIFLSFGFFKLAISKMNTHLEQRKEITIVFQRDTDARDYIVTLEDLAIR